jgi:predicted nucleic-acid-binding protein
VRAIDTNLLVRLVARDDHRQVAAAESFVASGAWVPVVALVEAVWVLDAVYRRSHLQIADGIALLLDHRDLVLQDADVIAAALRQFRLHPRVGFSDCLVVEQARKAGHVPLGTFDRAFSRLEGTVRV